MNWEWIKEQLGQVLNAPLRFEKMTIAEWTQLAAQHNVPVQSAMSLERDHTLYLFLYMEGTAVHTLALEEVLITASERRLVEMTIEAYRSQDRKPIVGSRTDDEGRALLVRNWIDQQLEKGLANAEMPEQFSTQSALYTSKVPLLLYGDYSDSKKVNYFGLKKLLETFFDAEIILIPLADKEWLILGSESLLTDDDDERDYENEESMEETLASICYGLYEMMASEWVGECHLSIHYPIIPAKSLVSTVSQLREAVALGRTFHVGRNIHLPWLMHLDRLLNVIPDAEKMKFIENVLKRIDHFMDTEMLQTLEHFFAMNCNVSETAKKLYIHRNTLLYRLDKFKQETGLDVRTFSHAVLVKIALLLYKVTKRK